MKRNNEISVNMDIIRNVGCVPAIIYGILDDISANRADQKGWFQITQKEISELCGLTTQTVLKTIKIMEQNKLIKIRTENTRTGNCYRMMQPKFEE